MDIIDPKIQDYCDAHTTPESETLAALNRDTHANVLYPRMLSGHFQGRLLSMISHMIRPNYILEIGTYTGYSAICLAEGLSERGKLITIDCNPEQEERIFKYRNLSGMEDKIQLIIGDAYQIIKTLNQKFDLVFIDADKENYQRYYDQVMEILVPGGYILIDNVLWSGKVIGDATKDKDKDKVTGILQVFNDYVKRDPRVEQVLLPVRDGLLLVRKRG
ncbi:MAG: O-methyltransferase [Bacteroidia bacterium]|jgi:predicted O-methyltransferase YrrM